MDERGRVERDYWDRRADAWDRRVGQIERFTEAFGHAAMDVIGPVVGARVLDVGCGPGSTTLDLGGRVVPGGEVVGLDISPAMVAAAERRARSSGVDHVSFVVHDLTAGPTDDPFDVVFSRFGLMFFPDRDAAFANLVASLRPSGRFACAVWSPISENPWMTVPTLAAAGVLGAELALPAPGEPGPFSLGEPGALGAVLETAGLEAVQVAGHRGRLHLPAASAAAEVESMLEIGPLGDAFGAADPDARSDAIAAVLDAFEPFRVESGWEVPGSGLVASGRRPG